MVMARELYDDDSDPPEICSVAAQTDDGDAIRKLSATPESAWRSELPVDKENDR